MFRICMCAFRCIPVLAYRNGKAGGERERERERERRQKEKGKVREREGDREGGSVGTRRGCEGETE